MTRYYWLIPGGAYIPGQLAHCFKGNLYIHPTKATSLCGKDFTPRYATAAASNAALCPECKKAQIKETGHVIFSSYPGTYRRSDWQ